MPAAPAKKAAKAASKPSEPGKAAGKAARPVKAAPRKAADDPALQGRSAAPAAPAAAPAAAWQPAGQPAPANAWTAGPASPMGWAPQPWPAVAAPPALPLRPVQGLAGALVVLLAGVVGWAALNLALTALLPEWGSPFATGSLAAVEQLLSVVSLGLSVAFIVVFSMWLYRVLANARQRHPAADISPGWAVGSFFIPIVHLFAPYLAVRRGWQADVSKEEGTLAAWFVPWALSMLLGYVAGTLVAIVVVQSVFEVVDAGGEEPDVTGVWADLRPVQLAVGAVSLALQAISAFFLVRVVRTWTALQEGRPAS